MDARLSKAHNFLLEWLGKEDASALGECKGGDLVVLVHLGLAKIGRVPPDQTDENRRPVSLTDAGRAALLKAEGEANG